MCKMCKLNTQIWVNDIVAEFSIGNEGNSNVYTMSRSSDGILDLDEHERHAIKYHELS